MEIASFVISIFAFLFSGYALWYKRKSYQIQEGQYKLNIKKEGESKQRADIEHRPEFDPMNNWVFTGQGFITFNLINVGKEARNLEFKLDTDQDFLKLKKYQHFKVQTNENMSIKINTVPGIGIGDYVFKLKIIFSDVFEKSFY